MPDFPQVGVPPLFISTFTRWCAGSELSETLTTFSSLTWPTANRCKYIPMWLPWPYQVKRIFWANGSSVTSTNRDFGIYSADGVRIFSTGSTAASGVSVLQYVDVTDFLLPPGRYYLGYNTDTTTANRGGSGKSGLTIARVALAGILEEAVGAIALPAAMTPVTGASTVLPFCGITSTASGF